MSKLEMTDNQLVDKKSFFSEICIDQCGGKCCDPWWGIVSFPIRKNNGILLLNRFKNELVKNISAREERIRGKYITNEKLSRALFKKPERYNVAVEAIEIKGEIILLTIRAMFAFRCIFLSERNECRVHPSIIGEPDIRPMHCGYMGSLSAKPDEKGYCKIIHTASESKGDNDLISKSIHQDSKTIDFFLSEGVLTVNEAAEGIITYLKEYCRLYAPQLSNRKEVEKKPGRNDPCHCGSGKKFKKCHC